MSHSGGARVSLDAVRAVFDRRGQQGTPLTATEVAEAVGCVRRTAHGKLRELVDAGELETKKVGARGRVWWRPPRRERAASDPTSSDGPYRSLVRAIDGCAVVELGPDGRVRDWTGGAERLTGYAPEEVLGEHISTVSADPDADEWLPSETRSEAADGGTVRHERRLVRPDGSAVRASVTTTAIRDDGVLDGFAAVVRDASAAREAERDVRQERNLLDRVLETSPVGIAIFDRDGRAMRANQRFGELLETDGDAEEYVLGDQPLLDADGDTIPFDERPAAEVVETGVAVTDRRVRVDGGDGRQRWLSIDVAPLADVEDVDVVATVSDVTQLHEQARRLERRRDELGRELDEVFDRVDDAFYALDGDWQFAYVNDRAAEVLERAPADLVGEYVWDALPWVVDGDVREPFVRAMESQETVSFERYYEPLGAWLATTVYPSETGLSVYFRDVTDRKVRERELERYESIVETIWDGVYAHDGDGRFVLVNDAFCELTGYDREELLGEPSTLVTSDEVDRTARELAETFETDDRESATMSFDLQTKAGRSVPVESRFGPYEHGEEIQYTGVVRDVTERRERENRLVQQRERLAALNNLHTVAQEITEAVIEQSTRAEIERAVCERLGASDSYCFAWVGSVDAATDDLSPHLEAGVDGYLDAVSISLDRDNPTGNGPAARAIRTKELQVSTDVFADPTFEPWREYAREYGFRAAAAIPIVHESTLFGILGVYADREDAFADEERRVMGQLGEVVGHAIAAVERKRALMSDEIVELEFRVRDVFDAIGVDVALDGTLAIDRTVIVDDDTFLGYGTATGNAIDVLDVLVEERPTWESASVIGTDVDGTRFELRLSRSPVVTAIATHGGYVDRIVFEGDTLRGTIHVPPEAAFRQVIDAVREVYPPAELVARRQTTRPTDSLERLSRAPHRELTDRQRAVLEAAYHSGYFEWPRESDGEDVAASVGVSPSTFHQHLRAAERNLLRALYADPELRTG